MLSGGLLNLRIQLSSAGKRIPPESAHICKPAETVSLTGILASYCTLIICIHLYIELENYNAVLPKANAKREVKITLASDYT